jgi:UDP-glucose 4-epimerase
VKKVLITGANSYIGVSFENYAKEHYSEELSVETVDMIDGSWREKDFSPYDIVYHVAGLAHADVGKVDEETKKKYYAINTDLAIETAAKAKLEGVKQFVFMSSAIIYGDSAPYGKTKRITADTEPNPANFYGDSKWQADKGVRALSDENYTVTVLRPPMIYGKGSKGNYPTLAKMAKKLPVFPNVVNERSMLYTENLCEFLCQVMIRGEGGVFWPQNAEYTRTSDMVKTIAEVSEHRIHVSKMWNWVVGLSSHIPGKVSSLTNKAFGNMSYEQSMSAYDFEYQIVDLNTSIKRTEG